MQDSGSAYNTEGSDATGDSIYRSAMQQRPLSVQARLEISQPGDASELQADRMADAVSKGDVSLSRMTMEQSGPEINMKGEGGMMETTPEFNQQLEGTKGQGSKLDDDTRAEMEEHMGADLSGVNIHTGGVAGEMNENINAKAFTHGQDIYFNNGNYDPKSPEGKKLLAHELTHTMQQKDMVRPKVQRSMKFEFQMVKNTIWSIDKKGKGEKLERKFGQYGPTEDGDLPAYLTTGQHGGPAMKEREGYVEAEGELTMKKAKEYWWFKGENEVDSSKTAQTIKIYMVTGTIVKKRPPAPGQLKLLGVIDYSKYPQKKGKYNPNTFTFYYVDANKKPLNIHIDEDGNFQDGLVRILRVGRKNAPGIDKKKDAQFEKTYRFINQIKEEDLIGMPVDPSQYKLEKDTDNSKKKKKVGKYNPNTYEFKYLNKDGSKLDIHPDKDGTYKKGHVKLMVKKKLPKSEQTAIELQSESRGYLEFETPKWFRDWNELKLRVQDAVNMTKTLNKAKLVTDPKILKAMGAKAGEVREWPFDTKHLKKALAGKTLYVKILDRDWKAKIQASEGIKLSQFNSLLKDHHGSTRATNIQDIADEIFTQVFLKYKLIPGNKDKSETLFSELKGFLQLIIYYIFRGQAVNLKGTSSKFGFALLARTSFASMYKELLSTDEKELFKMMLGDKKNTADNPIFTKKLNDTIKATRSTATDLTRKTPFYYAGHSGSAKGLPYIYDWLVNIPKGTDLLSGTKSGVADAMSSKTVKTTPGDKDYKQALFEIRGSSGFGANSNMEWIFKADEWVSFVEKVFKSAVERSSDTPDDLTTTSVNETSKTGLKYE
jgi:hypothetical protein